MKLSYTPRRHHCAWRDCRALSRDPGIKYQSRFIAGAPTDSSRRRAQPAQTVGALRLGLGEPAQTVVDPRLRLDEPAQTVGAPRLGLGEPAQTVGAPRLGLDEPSQTVEARSGELRSPARPKSAASSAGGTQIMPGKRKP